MAAQGLCIFQGRPTDLHHPLKYLLKEAPKWYWHPGHLGYIILLGEKEKFFIANEEKIFPTVPEEVSPNTRGR